MKTFLRDVFMGILAFLGIAAALGLLGWAVKTLVDHYPVQWVYGWLIFAAVYIVVGVVKGIIALVNHYRQCVEEERRERLWRQADN